VEEIGVGDGEVHEDGVHRRHRRQEGGLALADQVAPIHFDLADDAGDRRADGGVAEVQLRLRHRRLGRLDRGLGQLDLRALEQPRVIQGRSGRLDRGRSHLLLRERGVQILDGYGPRVHQGSVPGHVLAGFAEVRLGLAKLCLRAGHD
jgi:hypothetical protein